MAVKETKSADDRTKRLVSLVVLFIQSTSMVLFMRSTRTSDGPMYRPSTAVFCSEIVKVIVCLCVCFVQKESNFTGFRKYLQRELFDDPSGAAKIAVPSLIYAFQNNILFIALSHLEAATFQVMYQLKILTTAILSVVMLQRKLTPLKWVALLILMSGVSIVQLQIGSSKAEGASNSYVGFIAVLIASLSSGFAGVYFEKILKGSAPSIWIRNIQLGLFGVLFAGIMMVFNDGAGIWKDGMFYGYTWQVYWVVINNALGGLVVAMVVKYANSIVKGFALSISIVLSSIISMFSQGFRPTFMFGLGAVMVLSASMLYSITPKGKKTTKPQQQSPKRVHLV
uniref:UDP-N-acetylglucosamine transporter n=1 Tax=Hirondellea gigas TaxID=1518452 RepID=A0A6A7G6K9_9CRUS